MKARKLAAPSEDRVTHLIQGPDFFICDICLDACIDTLATKDQGCRGRSLRRAFLLDLFGLRPLALVSASRGLWGSKRSTRDHTRIAIATAATNNARMVAPL